MEEKAEVLKDEGEILECKLEGKLYAFKVANLGWYEPEKIAEKHIRIEKDERTPNITTIKTEFAEIDLAIMKKGILEYNLDGAPKVLTPDELKAIPPKVKELVVSKAAPNMNKERERLKNLAQS